MDRRFVRERPRRGRLATILAGAVALGALAVTAHACDVCAVYTATETSERRPGLRLGLAEQYTSFNTLQRDGDAVPNPTHQWLASSITQVLVGWNFGPRFGLQLNLPFIVREFRRPVGTAVEHGNEAGFGDLSLLAHALVASTVTERSVFRFTVLGGLKLPSGRSDRIGEELTEHEEPPGRESGIHGHDLALGSGSVDGITGGQLFWSWRRLFATAAGQYALRTRGAFGYRYANDLTWAGGPGVFALLAHDHTLGVQAVFSGETKGKDDLNGVPAGDTATTALYAGPAMLFTWGTSLAADLGADLPFIQHNTSLQAVPDYRVHGGATWRF